MIKQVLTLRRSRFKVIEHEYGDIISEKVNTDQTGEESSIGVTRKKYVFNDGSFLSITEWYTRDGYIRYYNYDWYRNRNEIIEKFHSEPHSKKRDQTKTEPFHIHRHNSLGQDIRLPNYDLKELKDVLNHIAQRIN